MKKLLFFLVVSVVCFSCTKEKETENNLPAWLQQRVLADEKEIATDPDSYLTLGAWIKYDYSQSVYFEYHNLLFSSMPKVYRYDGSDMGYALPEYIDYQKGKCCKKYVWKGKAYFEK